MNFFTKLIFSFKRPNLILVAGNNRETTAEAVRSVFDKYFRAKKIQKIDLRNVLDSEVLILPWKSKAVQNLNFFVKKSRLPVLVITAVGEIPPKRDFFAGEKKEIKEIVELAKILPTCGRLILNFDDETVRETDELTNLHTLTFGFQQRADFQISDIRLNGGTNFKINHKGNIVPFWLERLFGKEHIYAALASTAVGAMFGLNLVQISQALKSYQGIRGRMRLIKGIKNSWILDSSARAGVYSIIEALEILRQINPSPFDASRQRARGKIAVLGDVLDIGKYAIEAHESIGEKVGSCVDLLFTIGPRAKFIARTALKKGIPEENIFQFDKSEDAGKVLQEKIKQGDLIFIAGSKEMKMEKIVEEIKAT